MCEPWGICGILRYHEEIYSNERIISTTLTKFSSKKKRLFMWPLEKGKEVPCIEDKKTQTCADLNNCAKNSTKTFERPRPIVDEIPPVDVIEFVLEARILWQAR